MDKVQKSFEFLVKAADGQSETFSGKAAGIGNMDRGGDVIAPGAFASCTEGFLKDGSILVGHQWGALPIAMPKKAYEESGSLIIEAQFHQTHLAQETRKIMLERMDAGMSVGLSIGFSVESSGRVWFESGEDLLKFCLEQKITVDEDSVKAWKGSCRLILRVAELFETSVVVVPMNPKAVATAVKDILGGDGSHAGLSLADHLDTVLAAVAGATSRLERYAAKKEEESRGLSEARANDIKELSQRLMKLLEAEPRPAETTVDLSEVKDRLMVLRRHAM